MAWMKGRKSPGKSSGVGDLVVFGADVKEASENGVTARQVQIVRPLGM